MAERARMGTEWTLRLRQLEADTETAGPLIDDIGAVDLLGRCRIESVPAENLNSINRAAIGQRGIDACDAARIAVPVG